MEIRVVTENDSFVSDNSHLLFRVRVKVDGYEDLGLSQVLSDAEMDSHFDILWEYLGTKLKKFHKDRMAKV